MKRPQEIIIRPLITERAARMTERQNKVVFEVATDANKKEIKEAVETLFEVKVALVHTMNIKGKLKRMGRFEGRRPSRKKAIVTLAEGHRLDFFEGA
jgi:large subunit ribosomal protein L23